MRGIEEKTLSLLLAASGVCDMNTEMEYGEVRDVMNFARHHAVDALVADAIVSGKAKMVGEKRNDAEWTHIVMELASLQIQFERTKHLFDVVLTEFDMVMRSEEIDYVVFKGPAVASLYAKPEVRTMGDIDFYVPQWDYERALKVVENKLGVEVHRCDVDKHDSFDYHGIRFEMHYQMETFGANGHQRYFTKLVDESIREGRISFFMTGTGSKIPMLEPVVDIIVVMKHLMNHFMGEGVGLRQLMDYAVQQKAYAGKIDVAVLREHLRGIGYLRAFDNMVDLSERYFHLPWREYEERIKCHDMKLTEMFMLDIMRNGNFGRMDYKNKEGWRKRRETMMRFFTNIVRYMKLAPWDFACLVPKRIFISVKAH